MAIALMTALMIFGEPLRAQTPTISGEPRVSVPWAVMDWEPFYILKGPNAQMGRADRLKKILAEHMRNYQFTDLYADMPHTLDLWKKNKNVCAGAALKTPEREKWAYFTALSYQVPHRYVVLTARADLLSDLPKEPSLKLLLARAKWKGVFVKNRSYGADIDNILMMAAKKSPIFIEPTPEGYVPVMRMIEKGRYDYAIEYESVVRAFNDRNYPQKPLLMKYIKESHPAVTFYLACTKNDWGRDVVVKADETLQSLAPTRGYQAAVESWLDAETLKDNKKILDEFYLKRAKGPWTTVPEKTLSGGSPSDQ
ncbi:hypothetical protein EZJ49_09825 [Bdellovibrio bacteriovorus]|uniref:hypothetical protein n=1 Tax=Bdellovibrio bacteriovorus TaxID=959 RepID=UPI0021D060E8|nr:hypothetical protein [Bdellovibrio bacteriovorus]UXR66272.1 hypothetical protein EZJ49_09825 [Bdellovibrio bacteriovorus]